jgi:hypothetical protein
MDNYLPNTVDNFIQPAKSYGYPHCSTFCFAPYHKPMANANQKELQFI